MDMFRKWFFMPNPMMQVLKSVQIIVWKEKSRHESVTDIVAFLIVVLTGLNGEEEKDVRDKRRGNKKEKILENMFDKKCH